MISLPGHTSFSSLSAYAKCPKQWQLERVIKVPESQGWARLGGSAVHAATEQFDRGAGGNPVELFDQAFIDEIRDAYAKDPDIENWHAAKGGAEGELFWWKNGPTFVQRWIDWTKQFASWQLAIMAENALAVELNCEPIIGDRKVKMFIDRLYVMPGGELVVVDIKTGNPFFPPDLLQAALYAEGIYQSTGWRPKWGAFWFARTGQLRDGFMDLSFYTPEYLDSLVRDFFAKVEAGLFPPKITKMCKACSVRRACAAYGGEQAEQYDPDFPLTTGVVNG